MIVANVTIKKWCQAQSLDKDKWQSLNITARSELFLSALGKDNSVENYANLHKYSRVFLRGSNSLARHMFRIKILKDDVSKQGIYGILPI